MFNSFAEVVILQRIIIRFSLKKMNYSKEYISEHRKFKEILLFEKMSHWLRINIFLREIGKPKTNQSRQINKSNNMAISDVILKNKMYYVIDENGKEISHDWESTTGELMGFSSEFMVFLKHKMYYTRDEKLKEIAHDWESSLGEIKNVSGRSVNFLKNKMIYTMDSMLKEISHRWA